MGKDQFQGFSTETIRFLADLRANNNKEWFEENRVRYKQHLMEPLQDMVLALSPYMQSIDLFIEANPKRCISRINRDTRFSKDKSPYRANMWVSFKRNYKDWKTEPVFFFELFPDYYRYGMGFYSIPKETLYEIRGLIDGQDKAFLNIHSLYKGQETFSLEGEKYKRILNPDLPDEWKEWYQRKDIYFVCNKNVDERLFRPDLIQELADGFGTLAPIYHFFLNLRSLGAR
ncbi:DUF2461 domain-containing protein [Heliobacterium chlorum]|uniref:DUF2461 domain-containing protein n=1 Tax=Heliobacterium chlorum TaxID=2698 RepID=A0ABR7T5Y5_HELCL|nr:DUF2461 domain-containing protein [Heliobacterium chlorum]MBC9786184.1 DUF2461 domain-containing protein [Heliobacterium chlorum]